MQSSVSRRSVLLVALIMAIGLLRLLAFRYVSDRNYAFQGSLIEPPIEAVDFTLQSANGATFRLSDQQGKVVLIFFGYTHCPDFCPTTLADFTRIHQALGEQASEVEFVFVTVDPERDTPEKAADYASAFNPDFVGLSGTPDELALVYEAYFVYAAKSDQATQGGYLVDHSTRTIVIDRHGDFRATFPYGLGADAIVDDVRYLLSEEVAQE